jgi:alkanesulfonate monooxygenase SsuD/methylene tetrahydromethanopterin reductase-like flavin-dependent oxidoreductase (luciferase family)
MAMRFAVDIAPLGELADPRVIARFGRAAEASGWDGLSIWDSTGVSMGTVAPDPFLALAAVAAATERIRLIASVIALPRRRPQLVAQAAATLDRISTGRLVLGVGAGGDPGDLEAFGDAAPIRDRVARTDAALAVLDPWLRGEPARLDAPGALEVRVAPEPVQRPRPPIWFGAMRPAGLRRAARWDGWIAIATSEDGSSMELTPEAFGEKLESVLAERARLGRITEPFDVAVFGFSEPGSPDVLAGFGAHGATWWLESFSPMRGSVDAMLATVDAGPPRGG